MFSLGKKFVSTVMPGIMKPLRVLWNEVIGFLFLCFGVVFGLSTWRKFREFDGEFTSLLWLVMASIFVLMMVGYGVSSFWRARKINRS